MTRAASISRRRTAVLGHGATTGTVAETCRSFGLSRTRYDQWERLADH